jgi:hypothetical protein
MTPPGKAKMAVTVQDINKASQLQQKGQQVTPQDIGWSNYFKQTPWKQEVSDLT